MDPSKGGKARAAKLSPKRRREIAQKAAQLRWDAVFGGVTKDPDAATAELTTGLRASAPRPGSLTQTAGEVIPVEQAVAEILRLRAEQVGRHNAGATVKHCRGRWVDNPHVDPVVECRIVHRPFPGEATPEEFEHNMGVLAEQVAECLGQEVVWVHIGSNLLRATPPGVPGPEPMSPRGRRIR